MKKTVSLAALFVLIAFSLTAQNQKLKYNPTGIWKFDAPDAPYGYTSGSMEFRLSDGKYTGSASFTGSDYKIPIQILKAANDSISVGMYVEGADVRINLRMENETKMTGRAWTPDGLINVTAIKEKPKQP
ncbi:MAG TPA: hypothetical protein PLN06_04110 [Bacteroidales bacterium]|nr:hypothetical protein [Bacteroidales bacterium]HCI56049.1 hypothetical protein [Bacteroidales bacterium]HOU95791.1 hypothetical protein [Bacteroidales bacterium]HQG36576.1 hypothetical protein [Bacteroidales bacterium]HQG52919.1 hypothetical protein [Bacteroidales bacterium]